MSEFSKRLKKQLEDSAAKQTWKLRPEVLIGPNIPMPLYGTVPREILGNAWWQKTRKAAFAATNNHCIACGVHKELAKSRQWLEGHELYEIDYLAGRSVYLETVPLCHYCHNYVHDGRLRAMLDKKLIHQQKYVAIIQHGDSILLQHKLERVRHTGPFEEDWSEWRLVIDGVEYPPKYESFEEWMNLYA